MTIKKTGHYNLFREEQGPWRFSMNNLMKMEDREIRQGKITGDKEKIKALKDRVSDDAYLDHAISKIAADLSHYLTK